MTARRAALLIAAAHVFAFAAACGFTYVIGTTIWNRSTP